jgi:hypothetical protein
MTGLITCHECGTISMEEVPENACLYFYECIDCGTVMRPKPGDCCVFCSYGDCVCLPKLAEVGLTCCGSGSTLKSNA